MDSTISRTYDRASRWERFGEAAIVEGDSREEEGRETPGEAEVSFPGGTRPAPEVELERRQEEERREETRLARLLNSTMRGTRIEGYDEEEEEEEEALMPLTSRRVLRSGELARALSKRTRKRMATLDKAKQMEATEDAKSTILRVLGGGAPTLVRPGVACWGLVRVMDPDGRAHMLWTALTFLASLYTLFAEPYLLADAHFRRPEQAAPQDLVGLSTLADVLFALNLLAGPLLGFRYYAPGLGWRKELDFQRTSRRYAASGHLAVDALTLIPVQLALAQEGRAPTNISFLVVASFVKLLRAVPVLGALRAAARGRMSAYVWCEALRYALVLLLAAHWLGCYWLVTIARTPTEYTPLSDCDRSAVVASRDYAQAYVCALYWAVQTVCAVGYGDLPPVSRAERAVCVVVMLCGGVVFYTAVLACALGGWVGGGELDFLREMRTTIGHLRSKGMPEDVIRDAVRFYQHKWDSGGGYADLRIIKTLPPALRVRTFLEVHSELVRQCNFLCGREDLDMPFWTQLIEDLQPRTYLPGEWICRDLDPADRVFLLVSGVCVEVQESTGYLFHTNRAGSWFGELEMFTGKGRTAGVCAEETCDTLELSFDVLQKLFKADEGMAQIVECTVKKRMNKLGVARWRLAWFNHKEKILEMAEKVKRPSPPWPYRSDSEYAKKMDPALARSSSREPQEEDSAAPQALDVSALDDASDSDTDGEASSLGETPVAARSRGGTASAKSTGKGSGRLDNLAEEDHAVESLDRMVFDHRSLDARDGDDLVAEELARQESDHLLEDQEVAQIQMGAGPAAQAVEEDVGDEALEILASGEPAGEDH